MKLNDLGKCVAWGKEVSLRWKWLQLSPKGFGKSSLRQLSFLNPAKKKDLLNKVTSNLHFAATAFHFTTSSFSPPILNLKHHSQ